jgi:DUF4097 and DUF4098 domain-containing protein YvlB
MNSKVSFTLPIVAAALLLAASTATSAADRTFDRTIGAELDGTVEISNVAGSINVIGWDRAEVQVHATMEEGVERIDVATTSRGRTVVKVVLPNMSWHGGEAALEVRVPKGSEVSATAVSADLTTSQLTGRQRLQTVSGELRAEVGGDHFEAKTVSGDMRLRGNSKPSEMRLSSVSGNITLDRGAGDVEASSISGDVRLEVNPASGVRLHSTSGELTFNGSVANNAMVEAETVSGDVTLRSKAPQGFEYEASSFSGDIESCLGKEAVKTSAHGPGMRLNGTTGDGKARMRAKSMSGDIEICDH